MQKPLIKAFNDTFISQLQHIIVFFVQSSFYLLIWLVWTTFDEFPLSSPVLFNIPFSLSQCSFMTSIVVNYVSHVPTFVIIIRMIMIIMMMGRRRGRRSMGRAFGLWDWNWEWDLTSIKLRAVIEQPVSKKRLQNPLNVNMY